MAEYIEREAAIRIAEKYGLKNGAKTFPGIAKAMAEQWAGKA